MIMGRLKNIPSTSFRDMKVNLSELSIETTRKCNLACGHCMRGLKQNKSMDSRTLDNLIWQLAHVDRLHITGGEPFLEPDLIQQMAEQFGKPSDFEPDFNSWSLVTNGTKWNDKIAQALYELNKAAQKNGMIYDTSFIGKLLDALGIRNSATSTAQIAISDSQYHDEARKRANISKQDFKKTTSAIKRHAKFLNAQFYPKYQFKGLLNMGNAKELDAKKIDPYVEPKFRLISLHKVLNVGGLVSVDVNGNVVPTCFSYEEQEKNSFGNINDESLSSILHRAVIDINDKPIKYETLANAK